MRVTLKERELSGDWGAGEGKEKQRTGRRETEGLR